MLKWTPDYEIAANEYVKAGNCFGMNYIILVLISNLCFN